MDFIVVYYGFCCFLSTNERGFDECDYLCGIMGVVVAGSRLIKSGEFADKRWI
jgi:hypothetical protein